MKSLKQGLDESPFIGELLISDSTFDDESIKDLFKLISVNSSIKELSVTLWNLKHNGLTCILDSLKGCKIQQLALGLSNVQVDDNNGPLLQEFIIRMSSLETVKLMINPLLSDTGAHYIGQALKCSNNLRTLDLTTCGLTLYGIMPLCENLEINTSLTDLDLSANNISDDGIECLSQSLASNHALTTLNIGNCGYTELGIVSLATMLLYNATIKAMHYVGWKCYYVK